MLRRILSQLRPKPIRRRGWWESVCPLCAGPLAVIDTGRMPEIRCENDCSWWSIVVWLRCDRVWLAEARTPGDLGAT